MWRGARAADIRTARRRPRPARDAAAPGRAVRCAAAVGLLLAALAAEPRAAAAQQSLDAFAEALVAFSVATLGTYGDEGPQVMSALDAMERALAGWEADLRRLEVAAASDGTPEDRARLHRELGIAYLRAGRVADASAAIDAAVRLTPDDAALHMLRGAAFDAAGETREAARAFQRAWHLAPDAPAAAYAVWSHRADLDEVEASRAMDVLVTASRARQADGTSRPSRPFPAYRLLPDTASDLPLPAMSRFVEGYRLIARGEFRDALGHLRAAAAGDPLVWGDALRDPRVRHGIASFRDGRLADAHARLLEVVDAGDAAPDVRRMLGLAYLADDQHEMAVSHLRDAVAAAPGDERARIALARGLVEAGRLHEAEAALRDAVDAAPGSSLAYWWHGTVLLELNRDADARQAFDVALTLPGVSGRLALQAAMTSLHRNSGDYASASRMLLVRVREHPNDLSSHLELAHAYLQLDRHDDALAEYVAALLIEPRSAMAHVGIGQVHLASGRHEEAVIALSRGVALDPGSVEARYALAAVLARLGRSADAARELEAYHALQAEATAARRRRLSLDVLAEEAASWTLQGRHDRAATLWARIVDAEPAEGSHRSAYGAALAAAGRVEEAIEEYERAAALGQGARAYRALADLYVRAGRPDESAAARAAYERALLLVFRTR